MKKEFYNIAKLVTKNAKILDVGCGNGELMKYITENNSNYCIEIKKNLDDCNSSMQYDCTFLNDLMREKCLE